MIQRIKKRFTLIALLVAIVIQVDGQNTGPIAPEAMSFEPVDATDMVNNLTGNFTYVLPILEVPSNGGGYPIALSYHAGVANGAEASWVGLGWNLNPGALNRTISGVADDWNESTSLCIAYNELIDKEFYTVGAGVGINDVLNLGVTYTWGDVQGFGGSVGVGITDTPFGASIGYHPASGLRGTLKYGGASISYSSAGGIGLGASLNSDFKVPYNDKSIGISFSTNGGLSYSGLPSISGSIQGSGGTSNVSGYTLSRGFTLPFKLFYISFQHNRANYWAYHLENHVNYGLLYSKNANTYSENWVEETSAAHPRCKVDSYSIDYDKDFWYYTDQASGGEYVGTNDSDLDRFEVLNSILLPGYDAYSVSGQGITGAISPKLYQNYLITGNGFPIETDNYNTDLNSDMTYFYDDNIGNSVDKEQHEIYFDFDLAPSSFLRIDDGDFIGDPLANGYPLDSYDFSTDVTAVTSNYYDTQNERRGQSRHVEYFTNKEIATSNLAERGFIETSSITSLPPAGGDEPRLNWMYFDEDGIGAFTITVEDGKRYHYSLPVYQFEEGTFKKDNDQDDYFNNIKYGKYAYTWLLTAITGPDYVERGDDGFDEKDYGYWVQFDYGKWSDGYVWQIPYNPDMDDDFEVNVQRGTKQIYYLNTIQTRTHTAVFVKSVREDGLGKELAHDPFYRKMIDANWGNIISPYSRERYPITCMTNSSVAWNNSEYATGYYKPYYYHNWTTPNQAQVMKLDKILLVKNDDFDNYASIGTGAGDILSSFHNRFEFDPYDLQGAPVNTLWPNPWPYCSNWNFGQDVLLERSGHYFGNVYDDGDNLAQLESSAIKVIEFNYDNNDDGTDDYTLYAGQDIENSNVNGKLTLHGVDLLGKGGSEFMPGYDFAYHSGVFNSDYDFDAWGYDRDNPETFSLKSILTPVGTEISIGYESDVYNKEAVYDGHLEGFGAHDDVEPIKGFEDFGVDLYFNMVYENYNQNGLSFVGTDPNFLLEFAGWPGDNIFTERVPLTTVFTPTSIGYRVGQIVDMELEWKTNSGLNKDIEHENANWTYNAYGQFEVFYTGPMPILCGTTNINDYEMTLTGQIKCPDVEEWKWFKYVFEGTWDNNLQKAYCNDVDELKKIFPIKNFSVSALKPSGPKQGGGLRVNNIELTAGTDSYRTEYTYDGGIVSYAPTTYSRFVPYINEISAPLVVYNNVSIEEFDREGTSKGLVTNYEFEVFESFIPSTDPDASPRDFNLGSHFTVTNDEIDSDDPDDPGDVGSSSNPYFNSTTQTHHHAYFRKANIENKLSEIGRVNSVTTEDDYGRVVSRTDYTYMNLEVTPSTTDQGIVKETFRSTKRFNPVNLPGPLFDRITWYLNSTSNIKYPNILLSTSSVDNMGNKSETLIETLDPFTGIPVETININPDGSQIKTCILSAKDVGVYQGYDDAGTFIPGMNSKFENVLNKNMLSQKAAQISYRSNDDGSTWKPIGVNVQTWNDSWIYRNWDSGNSQYIDETEDGVWRKHENFIWGDAKTNGVLEGFTYGNGYDLEANWSSIISGSNDSWQKTSEVNRYDHYSNMLEVADIYNNVVAVTRYNEKDGATLLTASNATYDEVTHSGAEYLPQTGFCEGEVELENGAARINEIAITNLDAHTGSYVFQLQPGENIAYKAEIGNEFKIGQHYRASVWQFIDKNDDLNSEDCELWAQFLPGTSSDHKVIVSCANSTLSCGQLWKLITLEFQIPDLTGIDNIVISVMNETSTETHEFDDFRVQPVHSSVTSYVYDDETGFLTYILDNDNLYTQYEYDYGGRLMHSYKETKYGKTQLTKNVYNYAYDAFHLGECDADVAAGHTMLTEIIYTNHAATQVIQLEYFLDGTSVAAESENIPSGSTYTFVVPITIPDDLEQGNWHINIEGDWNGTIPVHVCNPLVPPLATAAVCDHAGYELPGTYLPSMDIYVNAGAGYTIGDTFVLLGTCRVFKLESFTGPGAINDYWEEIN